jgi:hypothetical protein
MLRFVALVRTDVSEELSASSIRVTRIGELGRMLAVTLMMEALSSSETSVLTRATRRNIPEEAILHSHCRENPNSPKTPSIKEDLQYNLIFALDLNFQSRD